MCGAGACPFFLHDKCLSGLPTFLDLHNFPDLSTLPAILTLPDLPILPDLPTLPEFYFQFAI